MWARKVGAQMNARMLSDVRGLANITLKELIDWHCEVMRGSRHFGKNKTSVLNKWRREHGDVKQCGLTASYLTNFVRNRRDRDVSGITINIDFT